ncbi:PREDICTED: uncharacterized protein LOC105152517 isoform X2 [Acromyrmex echinatior]|uniref:uncharacterized protein LOC105152517 isoform X2 n=1 Tax=Acromyrmex echinatior TaxID=103372 RepID=UPI000580E9A9|nr:PREDICTED: uncharacterized protein LOC105152517 isoform X2 [Acromyrmex echinatior]
MLFRFLFKMDLILELPKQIQKFLFKKEQEYGQLKFILSRATDETSYFVNEFLEALTNIIKQFNIYNVRLYYENDSSKPCINISPGTISCYNYFLLNTNFQSQSLLAEDLMLGHIVHSWPTLSPFLFIQIIWRIKCEDLLIESLMHLPLDLCVDILDITIRCINDLEILRAKRFVFILISKLYYRCLWLHFGILSKRNVTEIISQLVAHFQVLLDVVSSKFVSLELSNQKKHLQHGILLKDMLRYIKMCMRYKTKNFPVKNDRLGLFEITYGNNDGRTDYFCTVPIDKVKSIIATLDQELITLLLNQIKQVDCLEFMDWAEIDDLENITISLQRAIIIECHCFIEFMKQNELLSTNDHLLQCLEQLVGPKKPEESVLSLEELCHSIENGKLDDMKELMKYYKKWDLSVLQFISRKTELLNVQDSSTVLEYFHYIVEHINNYEKNYQIYTLILEILTNQQLSDMYRIVLLYTIQHFHDNHLTFLFSSEYFKTYIESNLNISELQEFRIILIFVMLNPKVVLTTLVRIAIGSTETEYQNVMFKKHQTYFLYGFFIAKLDDYDNLLTFILKNIWLHDNSTWCYKQFETFMNDMLQKKAITPDDLLNNVYIPCLIELIKKMSMLRKSNPMYLRSTVNNLLDRGTMILNLVSARPNLLTLKNQSEIITKVNNFVEPIDQILLAPLLQKILRGTVKDVIQNYERRCSTIYQLIYTNSQRKSDLFKFNQKALLRHMMLHATEDEYKNFAIEMTMVSWSYFGWANELEAYENVLHITAEAMQLALIFTDTFPKDSFVSLLRALMHYCNTLLFLKHQICNNQEILFNVLSKTLFSLKSAVNETQYGKIYDNLLEHINNMCVDANYRIRDYFRKISELIEIHFVRSEKIENESSDNLVYTSLSLLTSTTNEISDMFKAYQFVCDCIDDIIHLKNKYFVTDYRTNVRFHTLGRINYL